MGQPEVPEAGRVYRPAEGSSDRTGRVRTWFAKAIGRALSMVSSTEIDLSTVFKYDAGINAYLYPEFTDSDEILDRMQKLGFQLVDESQRFKTRRRFTNGRRTIDLMEEGYFYRNIKHALSHGLDKAEMDYSPEKTWHGVLQRLSELKGTNAKVLYVGAGNDNMVEETFPNTTHLDDQTNYAPASIKGSKVQGDIVNAPFPDESFDIVLFRNFYGPGYVTASEPAARLVKKGGLLVDAISRGVKDREDDLASMGRMHSNGELFRLNGLEAFELPETSSFERVYRKPN